MRDYYSITNNREDGLFGDPIVQLIVSLGNAAQVFLLILHLDPRPVGEKLISQTLGISQETARNHLRKLAKLNLVARSSHFSGYRSIWRGAQLILPARYIERGEEILEIGQTNAENPRLCNKYHSSGIEGELAGNADIPRLNTRNHHLNEENPRYISTTTTATTNNLLFKSKKSINKEVVVVEAASDRQNEIVNTLFKYHIGKNKAAELAKLPYLSVSLIEETARNLKARAKFSIPLLIHCLEDDPPPVLEASHHFTSSQSNSNYDLDDEGTEADLSDSETGKYGSIYNPIWEQLIITLSGNHQLTQSFKNHLNHCSDITILEGTAIIEVDDHFNYLWLDSNAKRIIENALVGIIKRRIDITFVDSADES